MLVKEKLDTYSSQKILECLINSQLSAVMSVKNTLLTMDDAISGALVRLQNQGRFVFVGAGSSGRLAAQEASELYPTFSWPKTKVIVLIAGGKHALLEAQEGAEDDTRQAQTDFNNSQIKDSDVVICVSASGNTPYTLHILQQSNKMGAYTIGLTSNASSSLYKESQIKLLFHTGNEVVEGSTRMAAGTAQKIALNMLTTTLMIKLNRVYDSFMIDLAITNKKLENRGIHIISEVCQVDAHTAAKALHDCHNEVKLACVYLKYGDIERAKTKLKEHQNNLRLCLED